MLGCDLTLRRGSHGFFYGWGRQWVRHCCDHTARHMVSSWWQRSDASSLPEKLATNSSKFSTSHRISKNRKKVTIAAHIRAQVSNRKQCHIALRCCTESQSGKCFGRRLLTLDQKRIIVRSILVAVHRPPDDVLLTFGILWIHRRSDITEKESHIVSPDKHLYLLGIAHHKNRSQRVAITVMHLRGEILALKKII